MSHVNGGVNMQFHLAVIYISHFYTFQGVVKDLNKQYIIVFMSVKYDNWCCYSTLPEIHCRNIHLTYYIMSLLFPQMNQRRQLSTNVSSLNICDKLKIS